MNSDDLKLISSCLDGQATEQELQEFRKRAEDPDFLQQCVDYELDSALLPRALFLQQEEQQLKSKTGWRHLKLLSGAAAALLITAAVFIFNTKPSSHLPHLAQAIDLPGWPSEGKALQEGKHYQLPDNQTLLLRYPDGSTLEIAGGSNFYFKNEAESKGIHLDKGSLLADVKPQIKGHPMHIITPEGEAHVLGTSFTLSTASKNTNLKVIRGKVKLANKSGSEDLVRAGEQAFARKTTPVVAFTKEEESKQGHAAFERWQAFSEKMKLDPDLVAYYDYQEGGGDILYNKAEATQNLNLNGEIVTSLWMDGRWPHKKAIYYSHYGYVQCGKNAAFDLKGPMTMFAWVKIKKFQRRWQAIWAKGNNSWRIARADSGNSIEFACQGLEPKFYVRGKVDVNDDKWHLVCGVYNGQSLQLYIDGELDSSVPASGKVGKSDNRVEIGANHGAPMRDFEGWMDECGLFKRALNTEEVKAIWDAGKK